MLNSTRTSSGGSTRFPDRREDLSTWALINGPYTDRHDDPAAFRVGGARHWDEVVSKLRNSGASTLEPATYSSKAFDAFSTAEVAILGGHSRPRATEGVILDSFLGGEIHPGAFPERLECRLLWLDTCNGYLWLEHGLKDRLKSGTVVVATESENWEAFAVGQTALYALADRWLSLEGPPAQEDLKGVIEGLLREHHTHADQNLKVIELP